MVSRTTLKRSVDQSWLAGTFLASVLSCISSQMIRSAPTTQVRKGSLGPGGVPKQVTFARESQSSVSRARLKTLNTSLGQEATLIYELFKDIFRNYTFSSVITCNYRRDVLIRRDAIVLEGKVASKDGYQQCEVSGYLV